MKTRKPQARMNDSDSDMDEVVVAGVEGKVGVKRTRSGNAVDEARTETFDALKEKASSPISATSGNLPATLHPKLQKTVAKMGFDRLTDIQRLAWEPMSSTEDVLVRSATGSGKTLAFALPLINTMLHDTTSKPISRVDGTLGIVMVPTRELAEQCVGVLDKLTSSAAFIVVGAVHGGEDRHKEKARLRKGVTILVCTPGRLVDHLTSTTAFKHENLRWVVLDEADRLLDMGFERAITQIMTHIRPTKRVLVSATITQAVEKLSHFALHKPTSIGETEDTFEIPSTLTQQFVLVSCKQRLIALASFLSSQLRSLTSNGTFDHRRQKIVVFVSTADSAEFHYLLFSRLASPFMKTMPPMAASAAKVTRRQKAGTGGMSTKKMLEQANQHLYDQEETVVTFDDDEEEDASKKEVSEGLRNPFIPGNIFKLHGNMSQVDRTSVFRTFKESPKGGVLFCTDVASRGLDMPDVSWIVHYDPPTDAPCYVHRVGRTARIGNKGDSLLFLQPQEKEYAEYLQSFTTSQITETSVESMLGHLLTLDRTSVSHWLQSAAFLTKAMNQLVAEDPEVEKVSLFAYQAFIRSYSSFPRQVKQFFDQAALHLGHVAASFAMVAKPAELQNRIHMQKALKQDVAFGKDSRYVKDKKPLQVENKESYKSTLVTKALKKTKEYVESSAGTGHKGYHSGHMTEFDA